MLAAIGDLVDDIVVRLDQPIRVASDTPARIARRRGGSAANVAVAAAVGSGRSRFLGQVGTDEIGERLVAELAAAGVDIVHVVRAGHTGSIVVLVDEYGERSFLTDPGSSRQLSMPQPAWLDGVDVLHVPLYSLVGGAIAETSATLAEWAFQRGIAVSIDLSSVAVIEELGPDDVLSRIEALAPTALFANADEAGVMAIDASVAGAITVVKHGAGPAHVYLPDGTTREVPAPSRLNVDTTGAGDAFAAGFLTFTGWQADPVAACKSGHAAATKLLAAR